MAEEDTKGSGDPGDEQGTGDPSTKGQSDSGTGSEDVEGLKAALAAARKEAKAAEAHRKKIEAELTKRDEAGKSESEKAIAAARKEGAQEALKSVNLRLAQAEVRSRAAGKMAKPSLAPKLIDASAFVDEDGNLDESGIDAALTDLLKENPELGVKPLAPGTNGPPFGGRDGQGRPEPKSAREWAERAFEQAT